MRRVPLAADASLTLHPLGGRREGALTGIVRTEEFSSGRSDAAWALSFPFPFPRVVVILLGIAVVVPCPSPDALLRSSLIGGGDSASVR